MTNEERIYRRFKIEFERGCHDDLACLCSIWQKWSKMAAAMGPDFTEIFVNDMCFACVVVPPPPLEPGRPINPGTNVPVLDTPQPEPEPEPNTPPPQEVVRLTCAPPVDPAFLQAALNEPVSEEISVGPNA